MSPGAPDSASYVTTATESQLTNEKVLGTTIIMKGTLASRPAASIAGRLYLVTDSGSERLTRDTGSAWEDCPPHWSQVLGKPTSFTPSAHAATHSVGGTDPLVGYQRELGMVRPEDYGAVGDDAVDDTNALQSAINAAISGKKRLVLFQRYKITDVLTVNGSLVIEGHGYTSLIHQTTNDRNAIVVSGPDVTIQNLRLQGRNATGGTDYTKNYGIWLEGGRRFRLLHCWLHQFEFGGIRMLKASDVLVEGCFFFENGEWNATNQLSFDSADIALSPGSSSLNCRVTIVGNHCLSNNSQGIYVNSSGTDSEVKVMGNTCVTLEVDGQPTGQTDGKELRASLLKRRHGIVVTYHSEIISAAISTTANGTTTLTRSSGSFDNDNVKPGDEITGGIPAPSPETTVVSITNATTLVASDAITAGTEPQIRSFTRDSGRIVIANNICRNTKWTGIYYTSSTTPSCGVQILGNSISRTGRVLQTNPDPSAQGGIMCNAVGEGLVIANNLVEDINIGPGIGLSTHLSTSNGAALIANNVVRSCNLFESAGLYLEGRPQNVLVTGNAFLDNVGRDIIVANAMSPPDNVIGDVAIHGNFFRKSAAYDMIFVAANDSDRLVCVEGNYFKGTSGMTWGAAVFYLDASPRLLIKRNTFVECFIGIEAQNGTPAGRQFNFPQIDFNVFDKCTIGIRVASSVTGATQVLEGNIFRGSVTADVQDLRRGTANIKSGYIGRRSGARLIVEGSAAPTGGTWLAGDVVETVGVTGPSRFVCLASGSPGTWMPVDFRGVSADRQDNNVTLTVGVDVPTQRFATALTANRTVTLSGTNARNGDRFRVVRSGLGNFTLIVGGLKTIPSATAAFVDVEYDGSSWILTGYGTL